MPISASGQVSLFWDLRTCWTVGLIWVEGAIQGLPSVRSSLLHSVDQLASLCKCRHLPPWRLLGFMKPLHLRTIMGSPSFEVPNTSSETVLVVEWINHVLYLTCCWDATVFSEHSSTGSSKHVCLSWVPEGKKVLGILVMKWGSVYQNWALLLVFAYAMVPVLEIRCGETWRSRPHHVLSWAREYSLNKLSMNHRGVFLVDCQ